MGLKERLRRAKQRRVQKQVKEEKSGAQKGPPESGHEQRPSVYGCWNGPSKQDHPIADEAHSTAPPNPLRDGHNMRPKVKRFFRRFLRYAAVVVLLVTIIEVACLNQTIVQMTEANRISKDNLRETLRARLVVSGVAKDPPPRFVVGDAWVGLTVENMGGVPAHITEQWSVSLFAPVVPPEADLRQIVGKEHERRGLQLWRPAGAVVGERFTSGIWMNEFDDQDSSGLDACNLVILVGEYRYTDIFGEEAVADYCLYSAPRAPSAKSREWATCPYHLNPPGGRRATAGLAVQRSRLMATRIARIDFEQSWYEVEIENVGELPGKIIGMWGAARASREPILDETTLPPVLELHVQLTAEMVAKKVARKVDIPAGWSPAEMQLLREGGAVMIIGRVAYSDDRSPNRSFHYCFYSKPFSVSDFERAWIPCPFHNAAP
jgi:hypothetical protein